MIEEMHKELENDPTSYHEKVVAKIEAATAIFDARLIEIPNGHEVEIVNNIIWRSSYDCYRNSVSTYGRHILGAKACFGLSSAKMIERMAETGFVWSDVPLIYKYGALCKKMSIVRTNDKGEQYTRTTGMSFCANLVKQDKKMVLELMLSKYYSKCIEDEELHLDRLK